MILAIFATIHQISAQDNPLLDALERVTVLYNEFEGNIRFHFDFKHLKSVAYISNFFQITTTSQDI